VAHGQALGHERLDALAHQIERGLNAPPTSSMGRLFDAAAALAGIRQTVNYEGQAAIEFEALIDPAERGVYPFDYTNGLIDPAPAWGALLEDRRAGVDAGRIAARFHNGVTRVVCEVCGSLRDERGLNEVALSGGVWQNVALLQSVIAQLEQAGFIVYTHRLVPANDGGLALGQAAIAAEAAQTTDDRRQTTARLTY
jgi:hydrogenase maturation protein HypF